jgi:hypothetical protein
MLVRLVAKFVTFLFVLLAFSVPAQAGRLLDLQIVNRASGEVLTPYRHAGLAYIAGNPGERYALRLSNRSGGRVLAVLSVDGVNVVTGETAATDQSGYVLEPYSSVEIAGWRKNLREIAQFYFTALPDSYAARTDRPDDVGVIGVAAFREKARPRPQVLSPNAAPAAAAADAGALRSESESMAKNRAERLGTGHGAREYAPTQYTAFERASRSPGEILSLRYDSHANLVARGVIPQSRPYFPEPRPFPGGFVPDPRG